MPPAETITTAADSDANIIFGATINPELDGEIIITVVATGFDASYFSKQVEGDEVTTSRSAPTPLSSPTSAQDDNAIREIDMNLDDTPTDFTSDAPIPNIWTIEEDDAPAVSKKDDTSDDDDDDHAGGSVVSGNLDDDLEKPSFLRRLAKRRKEEKPVDADADKTATDTKD